MKTGLVSAKRALEGKSAIVVVVDRKWRQDSLVAELDARTGEAVTREAKRLRFAGEAGQQVRVQTGSDLAAPLVILIGAPPAPKPADLWLVADQLAQVGASERARRLAVRLLGASPPDAVATVAEGVVLARYRFDTYRTEPEPVLPLSIDFIVDAATAELRAALERAAATADAVCLTRDLVNTPAGDLTPAALADRAAELAGGDLTVRIYEPKQLAKMNMGAILAVGQGSSNPPRLIEMRYEPKQAPKQHFALVGKGITFDSGGLSLKPAASMELMKRDMGGSATVIGAMAGIAALGLPVRVRAYVASAENMPDGNAIRPGDVLRARNGKSIEVLNTDAEGRLVLADALSYATEAEPRGILDFATLTGAVRMALGKRYAGIMGNDQQLVDSVLAAAAECGEGLWQLPLVAEYREHVVSNIADIKNTAAGAGGAGTITAALFLEHFVGNTPWAHVDFSSTVMSDGYPCHPNGPSGFGVRTAIRLLESSET